MDEYDRITRCKCNFKRNKTKCVRVRPDANSTSKPFKRVTKRCPCGYKFNVKTDNCEPSLPKPVRVLQPVIQTDREGKKCPDTFKYNKKTKKCVTCPTNSTLFRGKCLMSPTDDTYKTSSDKVDVVLPAPDLQKPKLDLKEFIDGMNANGEKIKDPEYKAGRYMIFIYIYLIRKYATDCSIFRDSFHGKNTMALNYYNESNTLDYNENIAYQMKECIQRGSDLIFITLFMKGKGWAHVNLLIYRPFKRIIERYEPHGTELFVDDDIFIEFKLNSILKTLFEETVQPVLKEFTPVYRTPMEICPSLGFQGIENILPANIKESGFCQIWSMFMMETILLNPTLNTQDIIQTCMTAGKSDPTYFKNVIRGYTQNMALEIQHFLEDKKLKLGSPESYDAFQNINISALIRRTIEETKKRKKPMAQLDKTPISMSKHDFEELSSKINELTPQQVSIYYWFLERSILVPPSPRLTIIEPDKLKNEMLSRQISWKNLKDSMFDFLIKNKKEELKCIKYFLEFDVYPKPFIANDMGNIFINDDIADELKIKYPSFHTFWEAYNESKTTPIPVILITERMVIKKDINKLPNSTIVPYLSLMLYTTKTVPNDKKKSFDEIPDKKAKLLQYMSSNRIKLEDMEQWLKLFK